MPKYIDAFVLPIHPDNLEKYSSLATLAGTIWKDHGSLAYIETVGDDLEVTDQTSFPELAGTKPGETVVVAFISFESREHRDAVNQRVMADPRFNKMCGSGAAPFDFKRMAYGGFKAIVEA